MTVPQGQARTRRRLPRAARWGLGLLVFGLTGLAASLAADRLIGLAGFPAEMLPAHPPNLRIVRDNIEYRYEFRTNSQGLRYREAPLRKESPSELRLLVMGDSFTEGIGVDAQDRFTEILEREASGPERRVSLINCGLGGQGPFEYARMCHDVGLRYEADGALFVLYANDVWDTSPHADVRVSASGRAYFRVPRIGWARWVHALWPRFYTLLKQFQYARSQRMVFQEADDWASYILGEARSRGIPEERIRGWRERVPARYFQAANQHRFNGWILARGLLDPDLWVQSMDISDPEAEAKWNAAARILAASVELCRRRKLWVGFVYTPSDFEIQQTWRPMMETAGFTVRDQWKTNTTELEKRLAAWAREHSVPFLSLTEHFRSAARRRPGALYFPLDGHWTPAGHRTAADALLPWLRDQEPFRTPTLARGAAPAPVAPATPTR